MLGECKAQATVEAALLLPSFLFVLLLALQPVCMLYTRAVMEGAVKPLPVLGAFAGLWGKRNGQGDVLVRVEVSYEGRPSWLEGSYETWIASWS